MWEWKWFNKLYGMSTEKSLSKLENNVKLLKSHSFSVVQLDFSVWHKSSVYGQQKPPCANFTQKLCNNMYTYWNLQLHKQTQTHMHTHMNKRTWITTEKNTSSNKQLRFSTIFCHTVYTFDFFFRATVIFVQE